MRRTALVFFLLATPLLGQQPIPNTATCHGVEKTLATDWYYFAVLDDLRPPDSSQWGLTITFSPAWQSKVILRTNGRKYELVRGTPVRDIYRFLKDLDASCQLPLNPSTAVGLIQMTWETTEVSSEEFARLHHDFVAALTQYFSDAQARFASDLAIGEVSGTVGIHSWTYIIEYDNTGYEHIKIDADDAIHKTTPIIKWVHDVLSLIPTSGASKP